jgi:hypothetical protein
VAAGILCLAVVSSGLSACSDARNREVAKLKAETCFSLELLFGNWEASGSKRLVTPNLETLDGGLGLLREEIRAMESSDLEALDSFVSESYDFTQELPAGIEAKDIDGVARALGRLNAWQSDLDEACE